MQGPSGVAGPTGVGGNAVAGAGRESPPASHAQPVARSLVIPMYEESARIERSIGALAASELARGGTELVLVDDGSDDGTADLAERAIRAHGLRGRVIRLGRNHGKGGAVAAGVAVSRGSAVAFSDADLSAPVEAIMRCFELVEEGAAEVVVTSRVHPDSDIRAKPSRFRRWAGKAFNTLLHQVDLTEFHDTQCGLKAFSRECAVTLFRDLRIERFAFDVEVLSRAQVAGYDIVEIPIPWAHDDNSRFRTLRDGTRAVVDVLRLRRSLRTWSPDAGAMNDDRFDVMADVERDHWWFRAKRRLVARELARAGVRHGRLLDAGCGTGATVNELAIPDYGLAVGIDPSAHALDLARADRIAGPEFLRATAESVPVADDSVDVLTSLDVIEHLDDDVSVLVEYGRVVRPGGTVILSVPAYRWAWSAHDEELGHRRRYTIGELERAVRLAGLEVQRATYFHSWLVPLALLLRRTPLRHLVGDRTQDEVSHAVGWVNRLGDFLARMEAALLGRFDLPFGLSVLVVARVPASVG
ncbi:MAG: glycosyltransferase [Acidimicrobiia bacterium]